MAYDSTRGRVLLFGGSSGLNVKSDLWSWDGVNWFLVSRGAGIPGTAVRRRRNTIRFAIGWLCLAAGTRLAVICKTPGNGMGNRGWKPAPVPLPIREAIT